MTSWDFSPHVLSKARRYLREDRVRRSPLPGLYYVRGTARRPYSVATDADPEARTATWVTCTCSHGTNQGAGAAYCSHAVAVLTVITDGLDVPVQTEEDPRP